MFNIPSAVRDVNTLFLWSNLYFLSFISSWDIMKHHSTARIEKKDVCHRRHEGNRCHLVRFLSAKYTEQDQTRLLWMVTGAFSELQAICQPNLTIIIRFISAINTLLRQAIIWYTELMCCGHYHTVHYYTHMYSCIPVSCPFAFVCLRVCM